MWNPSSSLWISSCLGLELVIATEGKVTFNALKITIEGKSLSFDKKATGLETLEAVRAAFPGEPYLALVISGKGTLHKKLQALEVVDGKVMGQVLPNASPDDFYIQNFRSEQSSYISLMRKGDADTWMARLSASGFKLLSLSFGPFPVQQILVQLNVDQRSFSFAGNQVQRGQGGGWLNWGTGPNFCANFPIKAESEVLDEKLLVAYGAAFQLLYIQKLDPLVIAEVQILEEARAKLSGNKELQSWGTLVLISFFLLLVVNFLVFSYYSSKVEKLSLLNRNSLQERHANQARLDEINTNAALLDSLGYNGGLDEARMTDQLAAQLPGGMSWKSLTINPTDEAKARNEKKISFQDHRIRLQGECEQVGAINNWIEGARKLRWVKSVQMENYALNPESGKGEFIISVRY